MKKIISLFLLIMISSCSNFPYTKSHYGINKNQELRKKIAFIIGNEKYTNLPSLEGVNELTSQLSSKLESNGWEIKGVYHDVTFDNLNGRVVVDLENAIQTNPNLILLVYYLGHGKEFNKNNSIIPVDFNENSNNLFRVKNIIDKMEDNVKGLNILVLDSCRDENDVTAEYSGFGDMRFPRNFQVAYSAEFGKLAKKGVFIYELIDEINHGYSIYDSFIHVRTGVYNKTGKEQYAQIYSPDADLYSTKFSFIISDPVKLPSSISSISIRSNPTDEIPKASLNNKIYIYTNSSDLSNKGSWTNFMSANNDGNGIGVNSNVSDDMNASNTYTSIMFRFTSGKDWKAVEIASSPDYWGDSSGVGFDLSGSKSINFTAKGSRGGEWIKVKAVSSNQQPNGNDNPKGHPYGDSAKMPIDGGWIKLTNDWQSYSIPIPEGTDLSRVINPLVIASDRRTNNADQITFFIDEIYYEK